ncbi:ATP-dependent Clp protease ATP-binding subunit [Candidatus Peregrinibacteria bacterium]|jgi:ATP-dependent Clp protease ATP-binding subunit ClpC|nr:ATP-dependent Clp protease ATP-binding subunit [Candidatus Peregrinibacteria bacterium]MBT5468854.1 ATP-dependent Clp protease ATP-binding subunit [Candidatus Peregrinibacteria bacterium]MBT7338006.1 ATP-dependent Clp protease ATP-binding subunit [Candidatus Peregrinibacteria bacterium]
MYVQFDPTATRAFTARVLRRFIGGPLALIALGLVTLPVLMQEIRDHNVTHIAVAVFVLVFTIIVIQKFITDMLENDTRKPLSKNNAACLLTVDTLRHMSSRTKTAIALLEAAMKTERAEFILNEMGLEKKRVLDLLRPELENEKIVLFLGEASANMERFHSKRIDPGIMIFTLFQRKGAMQQLLHSLDMSLSDLEMIIKWEQYHASVWHHDKWWSPGGLVRIFAGVGQGWVTGFNDDLDTITLDLSQNILYQGDRKVTIHLDKMQEALQILERKSQHNIIVTGDTGSGKESFIANIAYQLRLSESKKGYQYTHVLKLQAEDLLSGAKDPDTFMLAALKRAEKQGRYILIIENLGLFLDSGDANIRGVLGKFLQSKNINIIGIADTRDYHTKIKTDSALDAQFEKITLEPTSFADTMSVLMEEYFTIQDHEYTHVTYKALKAIVDLADRYIQKGAFPGKAIDLLHDTVIHAKRTKTEYVTEDIVREMVSLRAKMDISTDNKGQREVLQNLESLMQEQIVGQRHAITSVSNALKRAGVDISTKDKPLGTFLFLGPTGVGKTQTAKVLAEKYFGASDAMIRLDMNEYSNEDSVNAIIGSTDPRYPSEGFLTRQVQDKPFSLILLDEIEKADKKVINLFLQILDEGHLIDGQGIKTNFRNTIIIATSNAGAQFITRIIQENKDSDKSAFKKMLLDELISNGSYSPEFLNRFDDVVLYYPLTRDESVKVASMMIQSIIKDLETDKGIAIQIADDAVAAIADKGYSPEFGAREMKRAITDTLETYVADQLLTGEVKRGDTVAVKREDLKL